MGACCTGKDNKKCENQEEEIYTKSSRINSFGQNSLNIKPTFDLEIENSPLAKNLCCIIRKIVNEEVYKEEMKLSKFSLETLWNVYRFYLDDHSESNYLIYDFRENSQKSENFLKKFKAINYKIEQIKNFSNSNFQKFRKYIKDRNIIIIAKEDSIITIEEFIYYILENNLNSKVFLFDYNLSAKNHLSDLNNSFLEVLDNYNFSNFPFIFLSLRFFPHLKNESIIFLDFVDLENKNNNQLLCDKKYNEDDFVDSKILNFFKLFKIGLNLKINIPTIDVSNDKSNRIVIKGIKENKNKPDSKSTNKNFAYNYNIKFFEIKNIINLSDLVNKKEVIVDYIEMIKQEVLLNKSLIIQIPQDLDKEVLLALLLYFVWKLTDIDPINLTYYFKKNLFFLEGIKNYNEENLEKILKFLETNFNLPNKVDSKIISRCSSTFYLTKSKSFKNINNKRENNNSISKFSENQRNFSEANMNIESNTHFKNNIVEKTEEEKEQIRLEILHLQEKVLFFIKTIFSFLF